MVPETIEFTWTILEIGFKLDLIVFAEICVLGDLFMISPNLFFVSFLNGWLSWLIVALIASLSSSHIFYDVIIMTQSRELFLAFRNEREDVSLNEILTFISEAGTISKDTRSESTE
jgi:hypothetical protein